MSWISENYEKAALGGAAIVAIALGALSWKSHSAAAEEYKLELPEQSNDANVLGLVLIQETDRSFKSIHEIPLNRVNDRQVDLFTSVPIVVKKDNIAAPIDLLRDAPVHEGIDNTFWVKYGIDPGYDNSPSLDPDKDGFTNRDEFDAGTSPIDFNSHPDALFKLAVANVMTKQVHIKPTYHSGKSTFRLEDKKGNRLNKMKQGPIAPGSIISFSDEKMKTRFKFVAVEGEDTRSRIWTVEDLKPNKKGVLYKFDRKGNLVGDPEREFGIMDSTVEFKLPALNEGSKSFKVEENNSFKLPSKGGAESAAYLFKSIDLTNKVVVVEYAKPDGSVGTHEIKF